MFSIITETTKYKFGYMNGQYQTLTVSVPNTFWKSFYTISNSNKKELN